MENEKINAELNKIKKEKAKVQGELAALEYKEKMLYSSIENEKLIGKYFHSQSCGDTYIYVKKCSTLNTGPILEGPGIHRLTMLIGNTYVIRNKETLVYNEDTEEIDREVFLKVYNEAKENIEKKLEL